MGRFKVNRADPLLTLWQAKRLLRVSIHELLRRIKSGIYESRIYRGHPNRRPELILISMSSIWNDVGVGDSIRESLTGQSAPYLLWTAWTLGITPKILAERAARRSTRWYATVLRGRVFLDHKTAALLTGLIAEQIAEVSEVLPQNSIKEAQA